MIKRGMKIIRQSELEDNSRQERLRKALADRKHIQTLPFPLLMILRSKVAPSGCNTNILRKSITARRWTNFSDELQTMSSKEIKCSVKY